MTIIHGAGGGGKKGGGSNADDTLRSVAHAIFIDAISEGPIVGLVDGNNSIFINRTPLTNIEDSSAEVRRGQPDDQPIKGVSGTEAYQSVGVAVTQETGDQIRTILDADTDLVRVYMSLNSLYKVSKKGAMQTTDGGWRIDVRPAGGEWKRAVTFNLQNEKTVSAVQFQHDIDVTSFGAGPWDIRLQARYPDRTKDKKYESIQWEGYSLVTEGKFSYPHTALVALNLSAEHVGTSVPTRHYHFWGRRVKIPSNYNPRTRTYSGVWDGSFKIDWTNNPAWVFYDIATNSIFGLGNELDPAIVNKWQLYTIAQYCDQNVPSGYKTETGANVMEPRYTFNGVILDKKEAIEALRAITTVWRGMGFYSESQFHVTADMPQDVAHIYGAANVVDGRFEYSTSSVKARHSVVMVRFNDANNFFEPSVEAVIDDEMVAKYGWREKTVELTGCSSRSLARRYGKWTIDTEKNETETVSFTVGMDSVHALPGEIIAINDPRKAEVRASGRIARVSGANLVFDHPVEEGIALTGVKLYLHRPNGTLYTRTGNLAANRQSMWVDTAERVAGNVGCVFMVSASNVTPRQWRIISIEENGDDNTYKITALNYDRNKFARIESGIEFEPLPVKMDANKVNSPRNLVIGSTAYTDGANTRTDITIDWDAPENTLVRQYHVTIDTPTQSNLRVTSTSLNSAVYSTTQPGEYIIRVTTENIAGNRSKPISETYTVTGGEALSGGRIEGLVNAVTGLDTGEFTGTDASIRWRAMTPVSTDASVELVESDPAVYSHSNVRVFSGTQMLREQRVNSTSYVYTIEMNAKDAAAAGFNSPRRDLRFEVSYSDREGRTTPWATIGMRNPAPNAVAPSIEVDENRLLISWPPSSDTDIRGHLVWVRRDGNAVAGIEPTAISTGNSYTFKGASRTPYYVSVAGYDAFGQDVLNYANPILAETKFDGADNKPPAVPSGLSFSAVINPKTLQADVTASWTANVEVDFDQFQFEIRVDGANAQYLNTTENTVTFSVAQGAVMVARARATDRTFNWSDWSAPVTYTAPVDSEPPATPTNFSVSPAFGGFTLKWDLNAEGDLASYQIWEGTEPSAFSPANTALVPTHTVVSNLLLLSGYEDGDTRYFAVRAIDRGGNPSNWTALQQSTTTSISYAPPAMPSGPPTVTSSFGAYAKSGMATLGVQAANATPEDETDEFEVTQGTFVRYLTGYGVASGPFLPGVSVSVRHRRKSRNGTPSGWTLPTAHTVARDSAAPATVTGFAARPGVGIIGLGWTNSTATDLAYYDVYRSTTTTAPTATTAATFRTLANSLVVENVTAGVPYYFWVRAVDTSDNKSAWSARITATALSVGDKINSEIQNATWTASIGFITPYTGAELPTSNVGATISWRNKLYSWDGTKYVSSAMVEDIDFSQIDLSGLNLHFSSLEGVLDIAQIPNALITTDKIANDLRQFILAQGISASSDAAAAAQAALDALKAATDAATYRNEAIAAKDEAGRSESSAATSAGVAVQSRRTAILASGNERFQFELEGWAFSKGQLTKLSNYDMGAVPPVWVLDIEKNVQVGPYFTFARSTTTTVTIDGTSHQIGPNIPRFAVTGGVRMFITGSSETVGVDTALGSVDVRTRYADGSVVDRKKITVAAGWWPAHGSILSIVAYPAGTL